MLASLLDVVKARGIYSQSRFLFSVSSLPFQMFIFSTLIPLQVNKKIMEDDAEKLLTLNPWLSTFLVINICVCSFLLINWIFIWKLILLFRIGLESLKSGQSSTRPRVTGRNIIIQCLYLSRICKSLTDFASYLAFIKHLLQRQVFSGVTFWNFYSIFTYSSVIKFPFLSLRPKHGAYDPMTGRNPDWRLLQEGLLRNVYVCEELIVGRI